MNLIEIPGMAYLWAVEVDERAVGAVQYLKASFYALIDINADIIDIAQFPDENAAATALLNQMEVTA